jgi:hypothetical protein
VRWVGRGEAAPVLAQFSWAATAAQTLEFCWELVEGERR